MPETTQALIGPVVEFRPRALPLIRPPGAQVVHPNLEDDVARGVPCNRVLTERYRARDGREYPVPPASCEACCNSLTNGWMLATLRRVTPQHSGLLPGLGPLFGLYTTAGQHVPPHCDAVLCIGCAERLDARRCDGCGDTARDLRIAPDGRHLCESCDGGASATTCYGCGRVIPGRRHSVIWADGSLSDDDLDRLDLIASRANHRDAWVPEVTDHHEDPTVRVYCADCAVRCFSCDTVVESGDARYTDRYGWYCYSCEDQYLRDCDECGRLTHQDDLAHGTCDHCRADAARRDDDDDDDRRGLSEYHSHGFGARAALGADARVANPNRADWFGASRGQGRRQAAHRYYGVELEVEVKGGVSREDCVERVRLAANVQPASYLGEPCAGNVIACEGDGSLAYGFEIITRPLSLGLHRKLWTHLLKPATFRNLQSHNPGTCGLHVHVSRDSLTRLQIGRMVVLLNAPSSQALVEAIARRYSTGFCQVKESKARLSRQVAGQLIDGWADDRYEALNLTNSATVEFRIFRGTTRAASLLACLEFVHAVCGYCADTGPDGNRVTADGFVRYVNAPAQRAETKLLRAYLHHRGVPGVLVDRPRANVPASPVAPLVEG